MKSARGFTLIEVLLVIAIIGILATIIVAAINPTYRLAQARDTQRITDVKQIANALEAFYTKNGYYPPPDFNGNNWTDILEVRGGWGGAYQSVGCWDNWNAGTVYAGAYAGGHRFLPDLVSDGDLKRVPVETHPIVEPSRGSYCGYRYIRIGAGSITYCGAPYNNPAVAVIYTPLETTKPGPVDQRPDWFKNRGCWGEGNNAKDYAIYLTYY